MCIKQLIQTCVRLIKLLHVEWFSDTEYPYFRLLMFALNNRTFPVLNKAILTIKNNSMSINQKL